MAAIDVCRITPLFQFSTEQRRKSRFIYSISLCSVHVILTPFQNAKKYRYLKEKIVAAATGCSSMTDSFERLALLCFSIIILITQAACGT